jgi:hypothetical protein
MSNECIYLDFNKENILKNSFINQYLKEAKGRILLNGFSKKFKKSKRNKKYVLSTESTKNKTH